MKPRILMALLCFFACGVTAQAGERLFLKAGIIDPITHKLKSQSNATKTNFYILQFERSPSALNYKEMESQKIEWLAYLPDDALIVRLPKDLDIAEVKLTDLRATWPYQQEFKVDTHLKMINVFNQKMKQTLSVKIFSATDLPSVKQKMQALGVDVLAANDKYIDVIAEKAQIPLMAKIDEIEFIEEKAIVETMYMPFSLQPLDEVQTGDYTDLTGFEAGTKVMNFDQAWNQGFHGEGQIVAMADTGLDTGDINTLHQDFSSVTHGYSYGLFTNTWYDPMGHGTHVAGSVFGSGTASGGQIRGGAYGAAFIPQGMWSDLLKNLSIPPTMSKFLTPAYDDGARIHTNSWGNPRNLGTYDGMSAQVDQFMWDHPDMLIVFAAGNSGLDQDKDGRVDEGSVSSPSTAKNCLTVGASENNISVGGIQRTVGELANGIWNTEPLASDKLSNNPDGIAVFSSRGPTADGRLKPDVVAPGTNILSNCSHVKDASPLWGHYNQDYCYSGGTSMATPLTAGAAAVIRQSIVQKGIDNPSAAAVKAVMMNSAKDLYPGQFGDVGKSNGQELLAPGPNFHQGHGRVDVARAVADDIQVIDEKVGVEQGENLSFTIPIAAGVQQVKLNLVYTDRPAANAASKTLVNNLSLRVSLGNGEGFGADDFVNNSEYLVIPTHGQTSMVVTVVGERVMSGGQPFALAISNM